MTLSRTLKKLRMRKHNNKKIRYFNCGPIALRAHFLVFTCTVNFIIMSDTPPMCSSLVTFHTIMVEAYRSSVYARHATATKIAMRIKRVPSIKWEWGNMEHYYKESCFSEAIVKNSCFRFEQLQNRRVDFVVSTFLSSWQRFTTRTS